MIPWVNRRSNSERPAPRIPLDSRRSWRLDPVVPEAGEQVLEQAIDRQLDGAELAGEPLDHPLLVLAGHLAELALVADLRAVVLDHASRPRVGGELRRRHLHQAGHIVDRRGRQLLRTGGEAAFEIEELQQQREP